MPKYELLGTKNGNALYRDLETGDYLELPHDVVKPPSAFSDDARGQYSNNVARADQRQQATQHYVNPDGSVPTQHPLYPGVSSGQLGSMTPQQVHEMKRMQDREQVGLNRRNIEELERYKQQVMTANVGVQARPAPNRAVLDELLEKYHGPRAQAPAQLQDINGFGVGNQMDNLQYLRSKVKR